MLIIPDKSQQQYYLWVVGGRGGDNTGRTRNFTYFNDIWTARFDDTRIPKVRLPLARLEMLSLAL